MAQKRRIEIFSAGCPVCDETVRRIEALACPSCDVKVLNMRDAATARRARTLGVRSLPAIAIDGKLSGCCEGRGPNEAVLHAAGLGQPIP